MKEYTSEETGEFSKAIKLLTSVDFVVLCPEDREAELKATEELQTQISMFQTDREERKQLVEELREENEGLKNDLLDALDLKSGNGPTALTMLSQEIERLTKSNKELVEALKVYKTEHELPNDNKFEYNLGYVKAINDALNLFQSNEGTTKKE